ncbi:MAG: spondin domain-containing protein [Bacteroidota bacterium]
MKKKLLFLLLSVSVAFQGFTQSEATYSVTFNSVWSQTTHPHPSGSLPSNAHWSKLVGAVHNSDVVFLEMGELATPGVEDVAELGSNTVFFSEVNAAIGAGNALSIIDGDAIANSEGEVIVNEITVNEDYPLMTLLSMIAPSPDWMIAVNSVSLLDGNGDWLNEIEIDLYPYDAGTDSGLDYTSPDDDTDPQEPISSLQGVAPFSNDIIGSITINLLQVLGTSDAGTTQSILSPNPATTRVTASHSDGLSSVSVYNVLGKEVLRVNQVNDTSVEIDISRLPSGIYLVKTETQNNTESVKRLVKL